MREREGGEKRKRGENEGMKGGKRRKEKERREEKGRGGGNGKP